MSAFKELSADEQSALEQAADWHERIRTNPGLENSVEFESWLEAAGRRAAYVSVEEGLSVVVDLGASPELLDLRRRALNNVHRLGRTRWKRGGVLFRIAAAVVVLIATGTGAYLVLRDPAYETEVGERRIVPLDDGSRISMDSDSRIEVHFSPSARSVTLDRGRARFDVAHDANRPFTVTAGAETVVSVGTSFDVERIGAKVFVTLLQGHIVVMAAQEIDESVPRRRATTSLDPGEQLVALNAKSAVIPVDIQAANAWESGHLVFRDETLSEAVARINRYTDNPIRVDPGIANIRVSGVFNAGDVSSFVSAITSYFRIQATTGADGQVVLQARS